MGVEVDTVVVGVVVVVSSVGGAVVLSVTLLSLVVVLIDWVRVETVMGSSGVRVSILEISAAVDVVW